MTAQLAYFLGFHYPAAVHGDEESYGELTLRRGQGDWEDLLRVPIRPGETHDRAHHDLVAYLLERHTGEAPDRGMVRRFIDDRPGKSWARVTPEDLDEFCGQRSLPLEEA